MILDRNALSAFLDGDAAVGNILRQQPQAAIPVILLGEFRYQITGSRYRKSYEAWLGDHLRDFNLLPITAETTVPYATLRIALKQMGRPIAANDAWIVALAIQHGLPMLSRDEHFDGLPGIRRIGWS